MVARSSGRPMEKPEGLAQSKVTQGSADGSMQKRGLIAQVFDTTGPSGGLGSGRMSGQQEVRRSLDRVCLLGAKQRRS